MLFRTRTRHTPRTVVRTDGRRRGRRYLIRDLLRSIENGHRADRTTGEDPGVAFPCDVEATAGRLAL